MSVRGSEAIRIDGDDLLLDLADGSTVRVAVEGTNSDDETEMSQHFDGGGWPCWKVEGQDYVSVMFFGDTATCDVCGEPIPEEYDKHDPKAPVYGPEQGDVHHLGCEDELFEDVYAEVDQ